MSAPKNGDARCEAQSRGSRLCRARGGPASGVQDGTVPAVCWTACHWIPPGTREGYAAALRTGCVGTSEGPFTTEHAAEKLVGRVVGVWVPGREGYATGRTD